MDQATGTARPSLGKFGLIWVVGILAFFGLVCLLGGSNDTTQIAPDREWIGYLCLIAASLAAVASVWAVLSQLRSLGIGARAGAALVFAFMAFCGTSLAAISVVESIEAMIDFPPDKTRTYPALLPIARAYQQQGKHSFRWYVQLGPTAPDLQIARDDYAFMMVNRRAGDDANHIPSDGYFCAQVTLQQSGEALRVLHAGIRTLPPGTVVVCPPGMPNPLAT